VLLVPPLADWADRPDSDSLRWSDSAEPIATRILFTIFAGRLPPIRMRLSGSSIAFVLPAPIYPTGSLPAAPQREQAEILDALLACLRASLPSRHRAGAESQRWRGCC
jgi:tRNA(Met) cytidine acetyltransferase